MPETYFPMMVLPVSRVMTLKRLPKHEDIQDELVEWHADKDMTTLFVSQTWLRYSHPDNEDNVKLNLLQRFLRDTATGKMTIYPCMEMEVTYGKKARIKGSEVSKIGWVWFDIFSVPQCEPQNQIKAINSIAAYVANSAYFVVLAGPWTHENGSVRDHRAWARRGWCRVECLANGLAPQKTVMSRQLILVQSPSSIQTYGSPGITASDWMTHPIGLGDFTVEADRATLGPVVLQMIEERAEASRAEGTDEGLRWHRMLHVLKARLLSGTGVQVPPVPTLDSWMRHLGFASATEECGGWSPLRLAAIEGRADLVAALLDAGANANGTIHADYQPLVGQKGLNVIGSALFFVPDNGPVLRLLLSHGARLEQKCAGGWVAQFYAFTFPDVANLQAVLEAAPQSPFVSNGLPMGQPHFVQSLWMGEAKAVEWLLARYPDDIADENTRTPVGVLAWVTSGFGNLQVLALLLERGGFDLEYYEPQKANAILRVLMRVARVGAYMSGKHVSKLFESFTFMFGTALHAAAYHGNLAAVELLIDHRADVKSRKHQRKMSPLHVAALMGHDEVCDRLLQAGATNAAHDDIRRTPAVWAQKRGHLQLAERIASHSAAAAAHDPARPLSVTHAFERVAPARQVGPRVRTV